MRRPARSFGIQPLHLPIRPATPLLPPASPIIAALAACLLNMPGSAVDRRVVDVAEAGDPASEASHGFAGHDAASGVANGKPYRSTQGWMRYALTTYDDTEVTVALVFAGIDSVPRSYDVVVEDSVIASRTFSPTTGGTVVVELGVPFGITKGKASIAVVLRARGGPTPALHEIRTVQDHNETHSGADRAPASSRSQGPSGVVR